MKILELRFKNLNSLYGEWAVDLSDPDFVSNGIFALTGPTGAGKSTLLDAICLALYGATPRLGKITKSSNEIMSRQTGECYAEVLFECQSGRFRCHWAQHRARKKASNPLQDSRHEISDAETGKPIETKKSRVARKIETISGMDFDRFTRSMLLAQGGFDTFLRADAEDKSGILEQITGTAIYSTISRHVHERLRTEKDALTLLQAETAGITLLEPDQEAELRLEVDAKQKMDAQFAAEVESARLAIRWLTGMNTLKQELAALADEEKSLKEKQTAFLPDRERLSLALKATGLDGTYATVTAHRKQLRTEQTALTSAQAEQPRLIAAANQAEAALKMAEEQSCSSKEALKNATPLFQQVRALDLKLADKKKLLQQDKAAYKKEADQIQANRQQAQQEQHKHDSIARELRSIQHYLEQHVQDEWLVENLAGVEEQLNTLQSLQHALDAKAKEVPKAAGSLNKLSRKLEKCSQKQVAATAAVKKAEKTLKQHKTDLSALLNGRLLREYRTEKDSLLRELAFLSRIAELEDYRSRLVDGTPCPLCGAREHPFALGNVPKPDETEMNISRLTHFIEQADALETAIKQDEATEKKALQASSVCEKSEAAAANEKIAAENALTVLKEDLQKMRAECSKLQQAVLIRLEPLGIPSLSNSAELLSSLQQRLQHWQLQLTRKAEIELQLSALESRLLQLNTGIEILQKTHDGTCATLKLAEHALDADQAARYALFDKRYVDTEEQRLHTAITQAEQAELLARKTHQDAQQSLLSSRSSIASLDQRIENLQMQLLHMEKQFKNDLLVAGFCDEAHFLTAILPITDREALLARTKQLDDQQLDLQARKKDRQLRLATEQAKAITELTLAELEPLFLSLEEQLKTLREALTERKLRLTENAAARLRVQEKQSSIEAQQKECSRWESLHALIGSADGKKYRNFAQGLTFELMVSHANQQLEKMTDRYLLIRDTTQPLELNVVDTYQAGEIRSTRNLSGGESFIVSLTLALGLSKMASRNVRVDSLFLDEGFGTLDADALDTALETLAGLQQDGKLIGIISHVSALKERISTQINIEPVSGGRSTLSGPGCRRI